MSSNDKDTVLGLLREAFLAGYESPMELMEQEVDRIMKKHMGIVSSDVDDMRHEAFVKAMKALAQTQLRSRNKPKA